MSKKGTHCISENIRYFLVKNLSFFCTQINDKLKFKVHFCQASKYFSQAFSVLNEQYHEIHVKENDLLPLKLCPIMPCFVNTDLCVSLYVRFIRYLKGLFVHFSARYYAKHLSLVPQMFQYNFCDGNAVLLLKCALSAKDRVTFFSPKIQIYIQCFT